MKSKSETFDRSRLIVKPLAERRHDLGPERWVALDDPAPAFDHPGWPSFCPVPFKYLQ